MATQSVVSNMEMDGAGTLTFDRFAGVAAIVAGIFGFLYSIAFVVIKDQLLYSLFLLVGGLATTAVMVRSPGVATVGCPDSTRTIAARMSVTVSPVLGSLRFMRVPVSLLVMTS